MSKFDWKRVNSDVNGNPRHVVHYLNLVTDLPSTVADQYETAIERAKSIGGRKFHNKQYGGGIVFTSYSLEEVEKAIDRVISENANNQNEGN